MIAELTHLLETHDIHFELMIKDKYLHVHILPKVKDEKMSDADKDVLQQGLFKKYDLETYTDQKLIDDIHSYSNPLIEGTSELSSIEENIKKRVAEKKKNAKKPAGKTTTTRKRKTQAQIREEAREKQAKEKEGQADLFSGDTKDRLSAEEEAEDIATKSDEKKELKTAVEKAQEKSEDLGLEDL